jgi:hypothetical protein
MSYYIYDKAADRRYSRPKEYGVAWYDTERAAKGMCTRLNKLSPNKWAPITCEEFQSKYNPLVVVYNHITGDGKTPIWIHKSEVGTCNDPSTERYHSM